MKYTMKYLLCYLAAALLAFSVGYALTQHGGALRAAPASGSEVDIEDILGSDILDEGLKCDPEFISANTESALDLLKSLSTAKPHENIVFSPSSLSVALSLACNGTDEPVASKVRAFLSYGTHDQKWLNRNHYLFLRGYNLSWKDDAIPGIGSKEKCDEEAEEEDEGLEYAHKIRNMVVWRKDIQFSEPYRSTAEKCYFADLAPTDPNNNDEVHRIRKWMSDSTGDMLSSAFDPSELKDPTTIAVFLTSAFFSSKWGHLFRDFETQISDFTTSRGIVKKHPLMRHTAFHHYFDGGNFYAVLLYYCTDNDSMLVLLPKKGTSTGEIMKSLDAAALKELISEDLFPRYTDLWFPRFSASSKLSLNDLATMGREKGRELPATGYCHEAFPIQDRRSQIELSHRVEIQTSEKGTLASASSSMFLGTLGCAAGKRGYSLKVDRPFIYFIIDTSQGIENPQIVFAGIINDPMDVQ